MSSSNDRQLLSNRDDAIAAVSRILNKTSSNFEMVPFHNYNSAAKLRSPHYHGFSVVCHTNTRRSAGWVLCRHAENRKCEGETALYQFKTGQESTTKLERHNKTHKSSSSTVRFLISLPPLYPLIILKHDKDTAQYRKVI